eukprot:1962712-Prymnesium_polylepis.1
MFIVITEYGIGRFHEERFTDEADARAAAASLWVCWVMYRQDGAELEEQTSGGVGFAKRQIRAYARSKQAVQASIRLQTLVRGRLARRRKAQHAAAKRLPALRREIAERLETLKQCAATAELSQIEAAALELQAPILAVTQRVCRRTLLLHRATPRCARRATGEDLPPAPPVPCRRSSSTRPRQTTRNRRPPAARARIRWRRRRRATTSCGRTSATHARRAPSTTSTWARRSER